MTSLPVRSALGGQVIGSMATARRRRWHLAQRVARVHHEVGEARVDPQRGAVGAARRVEAGPGPAVGVTVEGGVGRVEHRRADEARRR